MKSPVQEEEGEESLSVLSSGKRHWGRILARLDRIVIGRFPQPGSPSLALGAPVELEITLGSSLPALALEGTPVSSCEEGAARIILFELGQSDAEWPVASSLQRSTIRVQPRVSSPIEVTVLLDGDNLPLEGTLADISETGMGLLFGKELEGRLHASEKLNLSFLLPGSDSPFHFIAVVRNRRLSGAFIRCGVRFEPQSVALDKQRARLRTFIEQAILHAHAEHPASSSSPWSSSADMSRMPDEALRNAGMDWP